MKVEDVLKLMAGMAQHKIAALEMGRLKLALMPERSGSAASGISAPTQSATPTDAVRAVQAARMEAARQAESKLAEQQQRTANARRKAAGGIGPGLEKAVQAVYEAAKAPQGAPPSDSP